VRTLVILLCTVGALQAQRPILYNPQDSTYIIPAERAALLELQARQYQLLRPVADSLYVVVWQQQQQIAELQQQLNKAKQPNIFERVGYYIIGGVVRFGINTAAFFISKKQ